MKYFGGCDIQDKHEEAQRLYMCVMIFTVRSNNEVPCFRLATYSLESPSTIGKSVTIR
jgi:hypothetical protein